ncbi:MAG: Asp-tRNA(Asn)/Glu-tRNA(Gln) amidotransferase subunit GatB [Clostridiales bacterium]|nr:Asp-tRNA(Asn)/Glu-tRNA(Gln) amidotransferase subunit GatB [Clostridiales bacterium]
MTTYETVIGLEFHAELRTKTKLFCGCSTEFDAAPNTQVCPGCLGLPGTLPVLNQEAVEMAVIAGLALNCHIAPYSAFDRKNYFYPDLPKAYQISQFYLPICIEGHLLIEDDQGKEKTVRINRIHIEEDAGKLVHSGDSILSSQYSLADYNRGAIPLIEIVTEPDLRSAREAKDFAEQLKLILSYTGVSDVKMEQGSLRCDANISLRPIGSTTLGAKTEIKNLNSFRALFKAIQYEESRQAAVLEQGGKIDQATLAWDEAKGQTVLMRSKEDAQDYRYFPDPDLPPIHVDASWLEAIKTRLPELPGPRRSRLMEKWQLSQYDADLLVANTLLADYFDQVTAKLPAAKLVANWLLGDISRLLNVNPEWKNIPISADDFVQLLEEVQSGRLSNNLAKEVLAEMAESGQSPKSIIQAKGWEQISDSDALQALVEEVVAANFSAVDDYRQGKKQALGFLIGQVIQKSKGKANPQLAREILQKVLANTSIQA